MSIKQKNHSVARTQATHGKRRAANTRSLKIVELVPYFYPAWAYGGPAKLVYDISRYLSDTGNQVHVLTSDSYDRSSRMPVEKRLTNTSNLVVSYYSNLVNSLAYKFNAFITLGMWLPAVMAVLWADVVHLHDFYTLQHIWIGMLCRLFHKPFVLSVHGCLETKRMETRSLIKRVILFVYGKQLLKTASKLIATSENEVEAYRSYGIGKNKIVLMGHGIVPQEFETDVSKAQARKELGIGANKIVITYLGRIHAIKGLDLLVSAIDLLKDRKDLHFVIAGSDDGYLPTLVQEIKKRRLGKSITRIGTCFGEQKARLFKASDIFVYPSYSEGFSLGILEAAASGLPLVLTQGCHFPQAAKSGAGITVVPDSKELAAAIMKFAKSKNLRDTSAKKARQLIASHYSMDHIGKMLYKTYLSVV